MTGPDPLVPADCDCRGLPFMPLEVSRLRESDLAALSTGDEFKAAVMLWCASWTQAPAASLPDDDRILARLAGFSLQEWMGLREMALRGWVMCSDGRFYHPLIADHAVSAYEKRRGQKAKADSRWAKAKKGAASHGNCHGTESAMPRHEDDDAAAPATVMQGTGTGRDKNPPLAPQGAQQGSAPVGASDEPERRRRPARAIPPGFPGPEDLEQQQAAVRAADADVDVAYQAERFRNWALGKDAKYVDWGATWRNWIARAIKDAPKTSVRHAPEPPAGDTPWAGRIVNWRRNAYWNRLEWGPPPGKPGCTVPAEILMAHGYVPTPANGGVAA